MSRQKQSVVDIKPLGVGIAFCPRLDVAGAQEARISDASHCTTTTPIGKQSLAKNVLPDALNDQSLGFGRARQIAGLSLEDAERLNWQCASKPPDFAQKVMQRSGVGDDERGEPIRHREIAATGPSLPALNQISCDARVIDSDHIVWRDECQPDRRRCSQAIVGKPLPVVGALQAEPFVNRGFVQTDTFDGGKRHGLYPVQPAVDRAVSEIYVHKVDEVQLDALLHPVTGP